MLRALRELGGYHWVDGFFTNYGWLISYSCNGHSWRANIHELITLAVLCSDSILAPSMGYLMVTWLCILITITALSLFFDSALVSVAECIDQNTASQIARNWLSIPIRNMLPSFWQEHTICKLLDSFSSNLNLFGQNTWLQSLIYRKSILIVDAALLICKPNMWLIILKRKLTIGKK